MADQEGEVPSQFSYRPDEGDDKQKSDKKLFSEPVTTEDKALFNWSAPDSFSTTKSALWYLSLIVLTLAVAAGVYFLLKDKVTTTVIVISGLLIAIYGSKKPKTIDYQLTQYGFTVNGRHHFFRDYRSFSIINHSHVSSIVLTPLKRFMPYTYIFFENKLESKISSALVDVLPKETNHSDTLDKILRRIGF